MFSRREEYSIDRDTQEGHDGRPESSDFLFQVGSALSILNRVESIDADGTATDNIGQAQAPFRQALILPIGQGFTDQFRLM